MKTSLQECKQLRKKYKDVLNKAFYTRQEITVDNTKTDGHHNACIMLDEYDPTEDNDSIILRDDFVPIHTVRQCDSFYSCQNEKCAYFVRYKKYNSLECEAESISKKLDTIPFWTKIASLFVKAK